MTQVRFTNRPAARHLDNFFSDFFSLPSVWANPAGDVSGLPAANVFETPTAYHLELNAPGRNKEDFKVNLEKDLLTISYEKQAEPKAEDVKTIRQEFSAKQFKRSFTLDDKVDVSNIQAKYENGILKIELPKKEQVKDEPKQITIS